MRRFVLALVVVVGLTAGAACGPDGDDDPDTTVPTAPATSASTTTATTEPDIATIPEVIDAPYLNRVLAALDKVELEATRLIISEKRVVPPAAVLLNSVYSDDEFTEQVDAWLTALQRDPELHVTSANTDGRQTAVERVITTSPSCVFTAVRRTYPDRGITQTEYLSLRPLDANNDPEHHNSTAWMIATSGLRSDGTQPSDPCTER